MTDNKCYYCDSTDTKFCTLCENWFCDKCRKRYDKRIISMIKSKFAKLGQEWLTKEEYDERMSDMRDHDEEYD